MGTFDQNKGTNIPGKDQGDLKRKDQFEHGKTEKDKGQGLGKKPGEIEKE